MTVGVQPDPFCFTPWNFEGVGQKETKTPLAPATSTFSRCGPSDGPRPGAEEQQHLLAHITAETDLCNGLYSMATQHEPL
jgi:hypothetical protein